MDENFKKLLTTPSPSPTSSLSFSTVSVNDVAAKAEELSNLKFEGEDKRLFDNNHSDMSGGEHEIKGHYDTVIKGLTIKNMSRGLLDKLEGDPQVTHIHQVGRTANWWHGVVD